MFWAPKRTVSLRRFFEYPQHMFWLRNKKIKFSLRKLKSWIRIHVRTQNIWKWGSYKGCVCVCGGVALLIISHFTYNVNAQWKLNNLVSLWPFSYIKRGRRGGQRFMRTPSGSATGRTLVYTIAAMNSPTVYFMRGSRGEQGYRTPPPPPENSQSYRFLIEFCCQASIQCWAIIVIFGSSPPPLNNWKNVAGVGTF